MQSALEEPRVVRPWREADAITSAAMRRIWFEVRRFGMSTDWLAQWNDAGWIPWARWEPEILATRPDLEAIGFGDGEWAEPQIVVGLPDEEQPWEDVPHVDSVPPWAEGRNYLVIAGVALTPQTPDNGGLRVWRDGEAQPVPMEPGDVVLMPPDTPHCGSLNLTDQPRAMIYHRLLEPSAS